MSPVKPRGGVIICPSCGVENKASSPFCFACKARLYDESGPYKQKNPKAAAARKAIRTFVITWISLTILIVVGLVLWPYAAIDIPVQVDPSNQVERYLKELNRRRDQKLPIPRTAFSQKNLNAYFAKFNDPEKETSSGVLLTEGRVLFITNEPFGPFEVSTRLILEPKKDTKTPFFVSKLRVGHLPIPVAFAPSWSQSLAERFGYDLDDTLWDELTILGVGGAGLVVDVKWE